MGKGAVVVWAEGGSILRRLAGWSTHRRVSKRQQKKLARDGAHALRSKAGWDPASFRGRSAQEALRDLDRQRDTEAAFAASDGCEGCVLAQEESGDSSALCPTHLASAMGF